MAPVGDRVYVKLGAEEQTTAGGILLPSSAVSRSNEGQVVAVGKDAKLSVGDQVMFAKYAGTEVKAGDDEYVLLKEDDVIGTMGSSNTKDMKPTGSRVLIKVCNLFRCSEKRTKQGVVDVGGRDRNRISKLPNR